MKKILLILMFAILLVGTVSAMEWDNIGKYSEEDNSVKIQNSFFKLFGYGELATVTLVENTDFCFSECHAIIKLELKGDYENPLDKFDFINGDKEFDLDYKIELIDYEDGSKNKIKDYKKEKLSKGTYYYKLTGYKPIDEDVDWIGTFLGVEVTEWAWWSGVPPLAYWNFDETSGDANDTSGFGRNLTNINNAIYGDGKFNNAYLNLNNSAFLNLSAPADDVPQLANDPFTIIVWANRSQGTVATINSNFLTQGEPGASACSGWTFGLRGNISGQANLIRFTTRNGTDSHQTILETANQSANYTDGAYHLFVATRNTAGNLTVYADNINVGSIINNDNLTYTESDIIADCGDIGNGIKVGGGMDSNGEYWNGSLDDIGIYNLAITETDIEKMWDGGAGKNQTTFDDLLVTLNLPLDSASTISPEITFNSTAFISGANLVNATASLWYGNGTFISSNFTTVSGSTNSTNISISSIPFGDLRWNVEYCVTTHLCNFSSNNFTLTKNPLIELSQSFNKNTTAGVSETFEINITLDPTIQVSKADLFYNNTFNTGTFTNIGGNDFNIKESIIIPITLTNANFSFVWVFEFDDGSFQNSTIQTQNVTVITADDCSTNKNQVINFSLNDEESSVGIDGVVNNGTIEIDLTLYGVGSTIPAVNFSSTFNNVSSAVVCISEGLNSTEYQMYVETKYSASPTWVSEFYNIQNFTLRNNTMNQNISLFPLKTDDSTEFLITFKDNTFSLIEDVLITVTRKYIGDGIFRTVEIPKTDNDGQTVAHLVENDVVYTFIAFKNGLLLATFENKIVKCEDPTIDECNLNLNAFSTGTPVEEFQTNGNVNFVISFNETTRIVKTTFNTIDGSVITAQINSTQFNIFGNTTVCTDELTSSSGTLTCTIPESFGNVTVISELTSNGELLGTKTSTIEEDPMDLYGLDGILMVILLLITLPFMALGSKIVMLFAIVFGVIVGSILGIYNGGSVLGVGSAVVWLIIAVGIVAWKISQQEETGS